MTAALAAKKAQSAKLGNRTNLGEASARGATANDAAADAFAADVLPRCVRYRLAAPAPCAPSRKS